MRAREIKDLSIAIEALSRVAGGEAEDFAARVRHHLDRILTIEEEEFNRTQKQIKDHQRKSPDEEIPF